MGSLLDDARIIQPLKDAGLWESFKKTREAQQAQFGSTAHSNSMPTLVKMLIEANEGGGAGSTPFSEEDVKRLGPVDFRKCVEYVFNYRAVDNPDPSNAPCPGAWDMLQYAKKNPAEFYRLYMIRFVPSKSSIEKGEGAELADDVVMSAIDDALQGCADGVFVQRDTEDVV